MPRPLRSALLATAVLIWLYGAIDPVAFGHSDLRHYWLMADAAPGLDLTRPQPFVFRPLGPWLAGVLPGASPASFYGLAAAASMGLAWLMWTVLRAAGRGERAAAVTVVLLAANPYLFGFNVFNHFMLNDVLALLAVGGALWAMERRRYAAMGAVLAVGVLCREAPVLVAPAVAVFLWQHGRLRADGWRAALALVPMALLFAAPRLVFEPQGGMTLAVQFAEEAQKAAAPLTWFRLLANAWAPAVALVAVWPGESVRFVREHLHLAVLFGLVLTSAFFGYDQERLMQPAVWAVYPLVALLAERHVAGRRGAEAVLLAAAALTSLHHITARFPLPSKALKGALTLAGLAAVLMMALALRWQSRRPVASGGLTPSARP